MTNPVLPETSALALPTHPASTASLPPVRRLVTGVDAAGRSTFVAVGPSPSVRAPSERPGYVVTDLWRTTETPARIDAPDSVDKHVGIRPPVHGSVVRIIDFPPDPVDPAEFARGVQATFTRTFGNDAHRDGEGDPSMHTTESIDYAILLAGELVAVMDDGEQVMRPGDVLVQRGTRHGWRNRSGAMARIAFVLIDGTRS
ncbi:cupin domain-containing protein [Variovorax sp. RCC_210]|uniref:cupin domain-containing protein n=1 Tax=Variovorax sp. RCC_210 TaxID=3239217 RepID=UPI0035252DBA